MRDKLFKISTLATLFALLALSSVAQTPAPQNTNNAPPHGRAARLNRRMGRRDAGERGGGNPLKQERAERRALRRLNLTDAQRQQMRDIEQRYGQTFRADREELRRLVETRRNGGTLTPEQQQRARQIREQLRANADRMRAEIQNLLTPEQRQQIQQMREEFKQRRRDRLAPPTGNANESKDEG
jgi:Spy/CpxP family protein refolding chaperone